jgi:hypothetical protein
MKLPYIISILTVFFFSIDGLKSQSINNTVSGLSPKYGNSVLFGKDIIINNQPDQDQTNIAQCSAFNGWLYAVYSYPVGLFSFMSILRSEDNGITWQVMLEGSAGPTKSLITRVSILACGNSISALKIFLGFTYLDTAFNIGGGYLIRYSGEPFVYEDEILKENDYIKDFALAGDYLYPATNSNPFSIAILYSKR